MKTQIFTLILFFLTLSAFTGKVVGVSDGDTITVLKSDNTTVKVRLAAIDCPESKQDFGAKAKAATSLLCFGRTVSVVGSEIDRYGRILAFVYVDDLCVNHELLRQGMAWHYKKYNHDQELARLEQEARQNKVGLWGQGSAIAPWDFRRQ